MTQRAPVLLIVGKGETWWDDVAKFRAMDVTHDVMGVNQAALWVDPAPRYAFSYHPMIMGEVKTERPEIETWSVAQSEGVDHVHRTIRHLGGSSGLLAAALALDMGYSKVVLAGIPLSGRYFYDFINQWIAARERLQDRVRSLSGATWAMLGGPDKQWCNGGQQ